MDQASKYQKKSKKKYIIFAFIIVLAVIAVVGIIFIAKWYILIYFFKADQFILY